MIRQGLVCVCLVGLAAVVGAQKPPVAPRFVVDPSWPKDMPNNWILGAVTGVFVDAKRSRLGDAPARDADRRGNVRGAEAADRHLLRAGADGDRVRRGRERRAGLGRSVAGHLRLPAQPARHLRRPQRLRLGRHLHAPPREEVHARRQARDDDRRVRQERRQQRHDAARRTGRHLGRSEDQRGVHRRRLSQPPRDRLRRRHRQVPASLGRVRRGAGRHAEARERSRRRRTSSSRPCTASPARATG